MTISIGPAKIYPVVVSGERTPYSINVKNPNDYYVKIKLAAGDDISNMIFFEEEEFRMAPREEKKVTFDILAYTPGFYGGRIVVIYSPESDEIASAAPAISVVLNVQGEDLSDQVPVIIEDPEPVDDEEPINNPLTIGPTGNHVVNEESNFNLKELIDFEFDKSKLLIYFADVLILLNVVLIIVLVIRRARK